MGVDTQSKSKWIDFGCQWIISVLITMKVVAISKWKLLPRARNAGWEIPYFLTKNCSSVIESYWVYEFCLPRVRNR